MLVRSHTWSSRPQMNTPCSKADAIQRTAGVDQRCSRMPLKPWHGEQQVAWSSAPVPAVPVCPMQRNGLSVDHRRGRQRRWHQLPSEAAPWRGALWSWPETLDLAQLFLVREALLERSHWLTQAPFLAQRLGWPCGHATALGTERLLPTQSGDCTTPWPIQRIGHSRLMSSSRCVRS